MSKIKWWTIKFAWEDGKEEYLNDIPNWVAEPIDEYLNVLEEQGGK